MEIKIDFTKSAQENAQDYFSASKKARRKKAGAESAIKDLEQKLASAKEKETGAESRRIKEVPKKEWYERFHWFVTSNGMLAIGGRDAQQNELLNSKHFDDGDLFFHADIFGASVVVLKNGESASHEVKEEAAQFAASYSRAWEQGLSAVDVYAVRRSQVSKSKEKGSLGSGSFLLSGEREWFKGAKLELCAFIMENRLNANVSLVSFVPQLQMSISAKGLNIAPSVTAAKLGVSRYVKLTPGATKKSDAAKYIAKKLNFDDLDYIIQQLPSGSFTMQ